MTVSAQTSTVHAATSNTPGILVTTESLSTAAGADYTFTWTNSLLVAGSPAPSVSMIGLSNTGGQITLKSVTNAVGSTVIIWTNTGTTAFNGTMLIAGHI
jgi:alanine dehydrogenase